MIKTFRGLLDDGEQDRIRLSTKKGKIGYKIIKFELFPKTPGAASAEHVVKVYKISQATIDGNVDFSDGNLLAAGFTNNYSDATAYNLTQYTIFEQEVFNQDIFVTHKDMATGEECNYYLEVEAFTLSDNAAAVSTLRDIRLNPQVGA